MEPAVPNPVFLNIEYVFFLIYRAIARFFSFLFGDQFYPGLKVFATLLVIAIITIILYCLVRLYELNKESSTSSARLEETEAASSSFSEKNETWEHIRSNILSDNQSDWRLGVIEADIYLDKVLDRKGFFGDTLGDKLKQVTEEQLPSVQLAWEAHKVRNRIAHDGAEYTLTQPEARRVLSYFEIVFRDLEVIP